MSNEKKKLSRNRNRRIDRRKKIINDMKLLLNKIKSEKKKINKNVDEIKELGILLVRIKYADNPNQLESALKELNKTKVIDKKLLEIKKEFLLDYVGAFEMVGNLKVGDQIRQTSIKFRNMDDFEAYIIAIDHIMSQKMLFSMGMFLKSILLNLKKLIDLNTVMVVILNRKLLNIEEIIVLYQLKVIVLLNVLII